MSLSKYRISRTIGSSISSTRDPIGHAGGLNLYAYCNNNPVNFVDPSGTDRALAMERISRNRDNIISASRATGVPKELIAGVIWYEAGGFSSNWGGRQQIIFAQSWQDITKYTETGRASLGIVQMTKTSKSRLGSVRQTEAEDYIRNEGQQMLDAARHLQERAYMIVGGQGPLNWSDEAFQSKVLLYYNARPTPGRKAAGWPRPAGNDYGLRFSDVKRAIKPIFR